MSERKIATVYVWQNGMAMVFDQHGEQMPEYQGVWDEVKERVIAAADDSVEFIKTNWSAGSREIMRQPGE